MVVDSSLYAEPGVAWVTGILVFSCLPENVLQKCLISFLWDPVRPYPCLCSPGSIQFNLLK